MLGLFFRNVKQPRPSLSSGGVEDAQTRPLKAWFGSWSVEVWNESVLTQLSDAASHIFRYTYSWEWWQALTSLETLFALPVVSTWHSHSLSESRVVRNFWRKSFLPIGESWLTHSKSSEETDYRKCPVVDAVWLSCFQRFFLGLVLEWWMDGWNLHVIGEREVKLCLW